MKYIYRFILWVLVCMSFGTNAAEKKNAHDFSFLSIDHKEINLSDFKGQLILIVNTASECGFTSQLKELQYLHEKYKDKGLVVIGVPSNDFGNQEPLSEEEIYGFTKKNFGVDFILTEKVHVIGKEIYPFYEWVGKQAGAFGRPKWNFHKYLIGKDGELLHWFAPITSPKSQKVITAIESNL